MMNEWTKTYKPLFEIKFGPFPVVFLNSPGLVQKLLASREPSHLSKPVFYDPLRTFVPDGLLLSKGEKWKFCRKILTNHMFSYKTLNNSVDIFNEEADNLVKVLSVSTLNGLDVPIEDILMKATLAPISKLVLGQEPKSVALKQKHEEKILEVVKKAKEVFVAKASNPLLFIDPIWRFHPLHEAEKQVLNFMNQVSLEMLESEFVFKDELLAAGVPLDGVFEEGWSLLAAASQGYETTASGLHFLLFFLALHPSHQEICRFSYVEMCLKESLRLIPVIPFFLRKITTPLDLGSNLVLPANTTVGVYVDGIHKNPEYYPDPEKFIPGRFSKEEVIKRHPYAFIRFSAGPKVCIGQKYATIQILVMASKILRHYRFSTTTKVEEQEFLPLGNLAQETSIKFLFEKRK